MSFLEITGAVSLVLLALSTICFIVFIVNFVETTRKELKFLFGQTDDLNNAVSQTANRHELDHLQGQVQHLSDRVAALKTKKDTK